MLYPILLYDILGRVLQWIASETYMLQALIQLSLVPVFLFFVLIFMGFYHNHVAEAIKPACPDVSTSEIM